MRFDSASRVEEVIWDMRIAEEPRSEDRNTLLRLYNGNPPFDEATAEENNIQINLNDLEGVNILAQARRQWTNAFIKPKNYFIGKPDSGPAHLRYTWSQQFTRNINSLLKRSRPMIGQSRATGANNVIFGIGPVMWRDRRSIVPKPIPVGSLLVPSETEIDDFDESLSYFAIFKELTHEQLYDATHGPRVDPGWNMKLVDSQLEWLKEQLRKSPNSLAYQYMPERITELIKQDKGYFGSDAVPTVDVWDFYFRECENGKGWYRRMVLDWGTGDDLASGKKHDRKMPASRNKVGDEGKIEFLYSSGKRKYANRVEEILHCQFGDCSVYAPFKYHSIRSLGWMLWGVCDLQNRLHCKFNEAVFEQLMWFFQTAGNQDLLRLKKVNFEHMGVIPQGIKWLTANERFTPDHALVQAAFARNRQLMADSSTTYTQNYASTQGAQGNARTATETMAIVNSAQALSSSIIELGYTYEEFKYREMVRRACLKNNSDPMAQAFQAACLRDGIPQEMLDPERWHIEAERVVGGGNKTVQMATVGFLNNIRKNLPPHGQRIVDHISVEAATDQPELAEEIAPLGENQPISDSTHDAQLSTERLMMGLEYKLPKSAVAEDYVFVWLKDLANMVGNAMKAGGMATPEKLTGMLNMQVHIAQLLGIMQSNPDEKVKVRGYKDAFGKISNHIKAMAQRLQQQMQAQAKQQGNGDGGEQAKTAAKIQAMVIEADAKAKIMENSAAARTRQKEEQFQLAEQRKDQESTARIKREAIETRHELLRERVKALSD